MRLFVDVDGTLVNWGKGENLVNPFEEPWEFNQHVLDYVRRWHAANPWSAVNVWSGGGAEYAFTWTTRAFGGGISIAAFAKQSIELLPGDVFIDDQPAKAWAHLAIHPDSLKANTNGSMEVTG